VAQQAATACQASLARQLVWDLMEEHSQDLQDSDPHHTANLLASKLKAQVANLQPVQEPVETLPRPVAKLANSKHQQVLQAAFNSVLVDSAVQAASVAPALWVLQRQLQLPDH